MRKANMQNTLEYRDLLIQMNFQGHWSAIRDVDKDEDHCRSTGRDCLFPPWDGWFSCIQILMKGSPHSSLKGQEARKPLSPRSLSIFFKTRSHKLWN